MTTTPSSPGRVGAVVLAAGKGTRFRSERPKVLHAVAGRTMLRWVLEALRPLGLQRVVVVVGHHGDDVRAEAETAGLDGLVVVDQAEQRGTGHAVRVTADAGALDGLDTVLVLPGDVPLMQAAPLGVLLASHAGHAATLLTTELDDPTGYGRVLRNADGRVERIVEESDADEAQRAVGEVATSVYAFAGTELVGALATLRSDNVQGEEYLTDVVELLRPVAAVRANATVVAGVNDRRQLADAGAVLRRRILDALMRDGVTVVDPAATYVGPDVVVRPDAVLLPGTHLEGGTRVEGDAVVGPDSRLVDAVVQRGATVAHSVLLGASVGPGAVVGPFAYLRPGVRLEAGAKAGSFVEMKQTVVGENSKVPHLSYLGDATVGRDVNVGAGTITCNYDGRAKHPTVIEDGAFIGSDTMLVAPVRVGTRAVTGAGSAITKDVSPAALAVERAQQRTVPGYADRGTSEGGP
ncbi:MAG: bifunctional UDP-N-acetylglucosamine diphosphorylase/glucosamine-1-phosphate N-acetyltransferase GlmU [Actinomycetota bacterium]|nr:bifunctional UDP-N-acetylglucosamine diphosphorylase/glucosamine-1-phosphate N-acetyltransferase GlmU [Actinomycetota bacterium]